jgi:hypothetical protein
MAASEIQSRSRENPTIRKILLGTALLAISPLLFLPMLAQETDDAVTERQSSLRVYFIGNSVTDTIN